MPLVTIQNRLSGPFSVGAPVSRVLGAGRSITLKMTSSELDSSTLAADSAAGHISFSVANDPNTPDSLESAALGVVGSSIRDISLSAAAEAANAIVVSGQVVDGNGVAVAAVADVLVEVVAITATKGQLTTVSGTQRVLLNDGAGNVHRVWIRTTSAGVFSVSVANDATETTLVKVTSDNGACSLLQLTFA